MGLLQERAIAEAKESLKHPEAQAKEDKDNFPDSETDSQYVSTSTDTPPDTRSVAQ